MYTDKSVVIGTAKIKPIEPMSILTISVAKISLFIVIVTSTGGVEKKRSNGKNDW